MSLKVPFVEARLKIKRANQHIQELNDAISAFVQSDFYSLIVEKDADSERPVLRLKIAPSPDCVPLILGDAIHNLRTSLDLVASEIVRRANGTVRYIKFPFRDTRQELEAAIKGGEIKVASPSVITAIIDEIRPYKGGNDPLCALHDLDVTDKHLLLIPVFSIARLTNLSISYGLITMENNTFIVGADSVSGPMHEELSG